MKEMKLFQTFTAILLLTLTAFICPAQSPLPALKGFHRVVFIGDSITYYGGYIDDIEAYVLTRDTNSTITFLNLGQSSETVSGLSEPGHAGGKYLRPDAHTRIAAVLAATKPDLVIADYGMNDGIYQPFSEEHFQKFKDGMEWLHDLILKSGAKIIHVTPSPFDPVGSKRPLTDDGARGFEAPYRGYNDVLDKYSAWLVSQRTNGWDVVDIHTPMNQSIAEHRKTNPKYTFTRDGVHPNEIGHWLMAREILVHLGAPKAIGQMDNVNEMLADYPHGEEMLKLITEQEHILRDAWLTEAGHMHPGFKPGLPLPEAEQKAADLEKKIRVLDQPFPGKKTTWNGFDRFNFPLAGKMATVVVPANPLPNHPWAWKAEFFNTASNTEAALLAKGMTIVYLADKDMYGCPQAVTDWDNCYTELTGNFGFAKKAALIGLSRGGLYCYNWAAANPEKVSCIYGDAPVCDIKSWPAGKGKGQFSTNDWKKLMKVYGFKTEAEALAYDKNPIDELAPLAAAHIPLLNVYGDADKTVPWDENTKILAERYQKLGGNITLICKHGADHHPHGLPDPTPIVNFIFTNTVPHTAEIASTNSVG
jgi:lysophospholipase L1-like esterase/dienelactone hydrolase